MSVILLFCLSWGGLREWGEELFILFFIYVCFVLLFFFFFFLKGGEKKIDAVSTLN